MGVHWLDSGVDLRCRYGRGPSADSRTMRRVTQQLRRQIDAAGYAPDWRELMEHGLFLCAATFRDSRNRWWFRDFHGALVRAEDPESAARIAAASTATVFAT